jgi:hypothetical protein
MLQNSCLNEVQEQSEETQIQKAWEGGGSVGGEVEKESYSRKLQCSLKPVLSCETIRRCVVRGAAI